MHIERNTCIKLSTYINIDPKKINREQNQPSFQYQKKAGFTIYDTNPNNVPCFRQILQN